MRTPFSNRGMRVALLVISVAGVVPNAHGLAGQTRLIPPPNRGTVTLLVPGPAPANLAVAGTPAYSDVTWGIGGGLATSRTPPVFSVQRWLESDPSCCSAQVDGLTTLRWTDEGVQWSGTYIYRVTAFYGDGTVGRADVRWVRPDPVNPPNFTGTFANGIVTLRWGAVPNVSWYQLTGPGLPNGTFAELNTFSLIRYLPPGTHTWTIVSVYSSPHAPAPVFAHPSTFPKVTVIVP